MNSVLWLEVVIRDDEIREDAFDWLCVLYGLMPNGP